MSGCTWVLHSPFFFLFLCISSVYMICLLNSEFSQLFQGKKKKKSNFSSYPWLGRKMTDMKMSSFCPIDSLQNLILHMKTMLQTMEKFTISLESRYQPHRRSASLCSLFFPLICINFYCSLISTPPTLKVQTFCMIQDT